MFLRVKNDTNLLHHCNSIISKNSEKVSISLLTASDVCGETNFTGTSGNISSPNYPNPYRDEFQCLYTIQVPDDRQVGSLDVSTKDIQYYRALAAPLNLQ